MATFTENYGLVKPGLEDRYDIADFNNNMDAIDAVLANIKSPIKSFQTVDFHIVSNGETSTEALDTPVDPKKCFVSLTRLKDRSGLTTAIDFKLEADTLSVTAAKTTSTTNEFQLRFQIIEFI